MKKFFIAILTLAASLLPAADLLKFCPNGADGALKIDMAKILQHPKLAAMLSEKKLSSLMDSGSDFAVKQLRGCRSLLIFYLADSDLAGLLLDSSTLQDIPAALALGEQKFTSRKFAGRDGFVVEDEKHNRTALIQLTDEVMLAVSEDDAEKVLSLPSGNAAKLQKLIASLPAQDTPVWLVGEMPCPAEDGVAIQLFKLYATFEYSDSGTEYTTSAVLDCPDENSAEQIKMLVDLIVSGGVGAAFAEDPKLGKAILKKLKISAKKRQVKGKFVVNDELLTRITRYVEEHPEAFSSLSGE